MALSRLSCSRDFCSVLAKGNRGVIPPSGSIQNWPLGPHHIERTKSAHFHVSGPRRYPEAPTLPLPGNVSEIFSNETGRFTPERVRDIATPILLYGTNSNRKTWDSSWMSTSNRSFGDSHVDSYDCFGAVSLNGAMQTNVPHPYSSTGRATHMNMPGGQWVQNGKYIAEYMQNSHYDCLRRNFNEKFNGKTD